MKLTTRVIITDEPAYQQILALRDEVLRRPLGMTLSAEDRARDHLDTIFAAMLHGEVIACLILQQLDDATLKLRQMAVRNQWQGKSVGRTLVQAAEHLARERGYLKIALHARRYAAPFYDRLGYHPCGDEFTEVGIPHLRMEKELSAGINN